MHGATKSIVLAVSAVFGLGLLTAAAANTHGEAVRTLAKASTALKGDARGDAVSTLAKAGPALAGKTQGDTVSDAARTDTDTTPDTPPGTTTGTNESNDPHGDAVSAVARAHSAVAALPAGAKATNRGGAVSAVARRR